MSAAALSGKRRVRIRIVDGKRPRVAGPARSRISFGRRQARSRHARRAPLQATRRVSSDRGRARPGREPQEAEGEGAGQMRRAGGDVAVACGAACRRRPPAPPTSRARSSCPPRRSAASRATRPRRAWTSPTTGGSSCSRPERATSLPTTIPSRPARSATAAVFRRDLATGALELVAYGDVRGDAGRRRSRSARTTPRSAATGAGSPSRPPRSSCPPTPTRNVDVYVRDMTRPIGDPAAYELVSARDGGDVPATYGCPSGPARRRDHARVARSAPTAAWSCSAPGPHRTFPPRSRRHPTAARPAVRARPRADDDHARDPDRWPTARPPAGCALRRRPASAPTARPSSGPGTNAALQTPF